MKKERKNYFKNEFILIKASGVFEEKEGFTKKSC